MIYITVDNDHTADLAKSIITNSGLPKEQFTIIAHLSSRNIKIFKENLKILAINSHPVTEGKGYKSFQVYKNVFRHNRYLKKKLQFKKEDILIVTTEYQLNSAIFAKMIKKIDGSVMVFDEGIGFYFNNHPIHGELETFKDKVFLLLYDIFHFIMRVPVEAKKGLENRMFPSIKSKYIDSIYVSMRIPVTRKNILVPYQSFLLDSQELDPDSIVIFASNFKSFNLQNEEIKIVQDTINLALTKFKKVYLKIHPHDWVNQNEVYHNYMEFLKDKQGVELIDNNLTSNEALRKIKPRVVVGTLSTSLFDAFFLGCQPVFLFPLLPKIKEFIVCRNVLESLGYKFISSTNDIVKSYDSNVTVSNLTFSMTKIFPN